VVLPAFALAYLLGRTDDWPRKLRQVAVGGLAAAVVSLSWMTFVTLTPAAQRPYVDGSQHNSVYEQVFVYNGFGRSGQQSGFQQFTGGLHLNPELLDGPPPGWNRLLQGDVGRDTGWLLPAALAVGVGGLFTRRRSYFILWTGWLVSMGVVFSKVFIFHPYYTGALSPPIAAILGAGVAGLWDSRRTARATVLRNGAAAGLIVAGTVAYGIWLIHPSATTAPRWLWPAAAAVGVMAVVLLLVSCAAATRRGLLAAALIIAAAAVLVLPATASARFVAQQRGFADTPFESASTAAENDLLVGSSSKGFASFFPQLEKLQMGAPDVMVVYTSAVAAGFISATGKEVFPIGGFTGSIPEPTIGQLAHMVRAGTFHLALVFGGDDPRLRWIAAHCRHAGPGGGAVGLFFCTPADAPAGTG